jgi:hypothetical protein
MYFKPTHSRLFHFLFQVTKDFTEKLDERDEKIKMQEETIKELTEKLENNDHTGRHVPRRQAKLTRTPAFSFQYHGKQRPSRSLSPSWQ